MIVMFWGSMEESELDDCNLVEPLESLIQIGNGKFSGKPIDA